MARSISVAAALVLGGVCFSGQAIAACSEGTQVKNDLPTVLTGNTVCASRSSPSERWQELHVAGGDLIDYKLGPGHAVDPSESVGSWSIVGSGSNTTIRYNYGSGGIFSYTVHLISGNSYSYCVGGAEQFVVTIKTGGGGCP